MKRNKIFTLVISTLLLCSPILFTQCSFFKTANTVASSINNISDKINFYDQQAKHYIAVVKKAKKGDVLAIAEAAQLLTKAKEYKKDLDKLIPQMSSSQKKEVTRIEQSILSAAKTLIK
ncbi:MAG: hypothetical protein PHG98_04390 [Bacteroidales bacterium]|jgi:ABC-type sulfate transport system substrate-binding protein|uniref:Uncharacterized protein n=1 Tax=bioreactor metagenome TaxID=1076179 RepID=A0A644W5Z8_9ZZZZ|nr:hypothetical protein [Bacteroidales bacterium]MDD2530840.1 hypothetical protein [Bacteroidales bacterium]MDD4739170.1 hypothetical protein [Bacteroidales bacterium]MEA4967725.1 hypothetical protein [Bacteroidaceae bacterium]MEA5100661.1 hypothetical protein [Bacteroidales bacterium]